VKIHGKVTHGDGSANEPLEFVSVQIAGTAIGALTELDGTYSISAPQADTIKVTFRCIGFHEITSKLIEPANDVTLNVKMLPSISDLQEVTVTDFRKQITSMQTVDADAYRLSPDVSGGSIESLLTTMAGVNS